MKTPEKRHRFDFPTAFAVMGAWCVIAVLAWSLVIPGAPAFNGLSLAGVAFLVVACVLRNPWRP